MHNGVPIQARNLFCNTCKLEKKRDFPEAPDEEEVPSSGFFGAYLSDAFETQSPVKPSSSFPPPVPPMDFLPCTGMKIHSISHNLVDRLAGAAWDGCLTCVSHLMTTLQVNPTETPEFLAPFRLSARDAALYGASLQRPMCAEVHLYIEDHLLEMSQEETFRDSETFHNAPAFPPPFPTTPVRPLRFLPRLSTRKKRRRKPTSRFENITEEVPAASQEIAFHGNVPSSRVDDVHLADEDWPLRDEDFSCRQFTL